MQVGGSATGTSRKSDDHFDIQHFRQEHGLAERVDIFLRVLNVGMNWIAVTTEGGDANALVFKFLLPSLGPGFILNKVVQWTMTIVWIAAGANFHGFEAERADLVQHFVKR